MPTPLQVLRYHVTGAIERGESTAIEGKTMDARVNSKRDIIESSSIVVQPGCMAHRLVIRKLGSEFVVHNEYLKTVTPTDGNLVAFAHNSFENGDYFSWGVNATYKTEEAALAKAIDSYNERVAKLFGRKS